MKPNCKNHIAASFPTRLILSFGLAFAGLGFQSAQAATWSGGGADANWSTALNWDIALANSFSTSLVFAGSTQTTNTNDLTGGTASSITFNSGAGAFVLGGTSIALGGNITNSSTSLQTINLPMTTSVSNTVTTAAGGGDITLGGVIGGNGNITKAGAGTLLISGANTYTGNTIVSAGTLKNGSATTFTNKGALILNGTGTFDLNGFNASFNNEGGSVAANIITNNGAADAALTIAGTNSGNFAGLLSDGAKKLGVAMSNNNSFGIFLSNTGNTFSGGLTLLNQGPNGTRLSITQAIVTTGSPGAITSSTYGTGPITIGQIATDRAGILINVATTLPNAIVFNTALGNDNPGIRLEANGIVLSGAITANSNAAFSGTGASATVSGAISGTGGLTSTNTGVLTLSGSNTYNGVTTINAGTLKFAKTASLYNGSTGSWTAANLNVKSGGTAAFNVGGTDEFSMADVTTLLTNLAASSSATNGMNAGSVLGFDTTNASGGTFTITDVIANSTGASGGSRGLIKSGSGTLALTGANTYTGNTTVSGGTLNLAGSSTGTLGAISVAGSGTTQLNIQAGSYTLGNVGLFVGNTAGNGTVNQSGGAVTWNNASLQLLIGNTTGAGTSGTYNLSGGSLTLFANGSGNRGVVLGVNPNTTATFNLSGTGTLVDNGVLQIGRSETGSSSANTTNLFTQTGGTATVANLTMGGTGLGTGITATLNLSSGTFSATSFTSNAAANTNTSVITIGGTAEVTLPVFPTVHGTGSTATITFDSTPGGGGFLAPTAASAAYMPAGSFTHAYLTANGANFNVGSGKDVTVAQVLENNTGAVGTLTKTGAGVLTLSGANIYTGNTTVVSGTLIVSANSATTFADTATVSIASGAVLNLPNAVTDTVASLVINGSILPGGIYDASSPATSGFITGSGKIQIISAGYSSWAAANVGGALANVDTDLDGVQNGLEYFMNSAPGFTANPALVVSAGPVRTVTWSNGGNIPSTGYGTQFVVQTSPNLSTWTNVLSGDPNLSNTSGSVIFTLPTGAGEIFVRLVVTPN